MVKKNIHTKTSQLPLFSCFFLLICDTYIKDSGNLNFKIRHMQYPPFLLALHPYWYNLTYIFATGKTKRLQVKLDRKYQLESKKKTPDSFRSFYLYRASNCFITTYSKKAWIELFFAIVYSSALNFLST